MTTKPLAATVRPGSEGPLVLVHGLSQTRHFWGPVIARLPGVNIHSVDARGHGETGGELSDDFSVPACAADLVAYCAEQQLNRPTLVGHSWGGAVVLAAAAMMDVHAVVMIDGGFVDMSMLGDRAQVRERLLPPRLDIEPELLLNAIATGNLAPYWNDECRDALLPSFRLNEHGRLVSVIGYDRHLAVLDGLLDYTPQFAEVDAPAWVVSCEPVRAGGDGYDSEQWQRTREHGLGRAAVELRDPRILRLLGAIHDVPLSWPDLTAGLIRSALR